MKSHKNKRKRIFPPSDGKHAAVRILGQDFKHERKKKEGGR